jgi:hypothetical protein
MHEAVVFKQLDCAATDSRFGSYTLFPLDVHPERRARIRGYNGASGKSFGLSLSGLRRSLHSRGTPRY